MAHRVMGLLLLVVVSGCAAPAPVGAPVVLAGFTDDCTLVMVEQTTWMGRLEAFLPPGFYGEPVQAPGGAANATSFGAVVVLDAECEDHEFSVTAIRVTQTVAPRIDWPHQVYLISHSGLGLKGDPQFAVVTAPNGSGMDSRLVGEDRGHQLTVHPGAAERARPLPLVLWSKEGAYSFVAPSGGPAAAAACHMAPNAPFVAATGSAKCVLATGGHWERAQVSMAPIDARAPPKT